MRDRFERILSELFEPEPVDVFNCNNDNPSYFYLYKPKEEEKDSDEKGILVLVAKYSSAEIGKDTEIEDSMKDVLKRRAQKAAKESLTLFLTKGELLECG